MGVRGIDISNHQAGMNTERVVRDNAIGFVFILSNDGTFKNIYYADQAAAARRGGATVVPYVYLRTNVDQTFATFRQQVPVPGPVIVDVEDGSGGVAECRRMHDLLHEAGYTTPLLYWPDWYRRKVGSPALVGFPPLWTSWYPDNTSRGFDAGLSMLPAWVWNGYGGLPTLIVQFTSSGRLSGYEANLDLNYFPGSREELDSLLLGKDSDMDVWDLVRFRPNNNQNIWDALKQIQDNQVADAARDNALAVALAAATKDPAITPEALRAQLDAAVKDHFPTAEQIAEAQRPHLLDAVREALGEDNTDQADAFVDAVVARLAGGRETQKEQD